MSKMLGIWRCTKYYSFLNLKYMESIDEFIDLFDTSHEDIVYCPILYSKNKPNYTWRASFSVLLDNKKYFNFSEFSNVLLAKLPSNSTFRYYIEYGQDKKNTSATDIKSGKNLGRKNETTLLEQGIKDIFSLYKKKFNTYSFKKYDNIHIENIDMLYDTQHNVFVYNMNLTKYVDGMKIPFPILIQPKFNGLLSILVLYNGTCTMYSRQLKIFKSSVQHIKNEYTEFINLNNIYFVGELYNHELKLQDIMSISRSDKPNDQLYFYIVDYFIIGDKSTASTRQDKIREYGVKYNLKYIKFIPSKKVNSYDEIKIEHSNNLKNNYEGSVLRLADKPFEYGINHAIRSKYIMKYKPLYEDECPIVGYTNDAYGGIVFICAQPKSINSEKLELRRTFNVVPNWTTDIRIKAFNKMTAELFKSKYYGHHAKIYYNDLSKDNIPLQSKMEAFVEHDLYVLLTC